MSYSTGNLERDKMLRKAINRVRGRGEEMTLENIASKLPPDFQVDEQEAEGMLEAMQAGVSSSAPAASAVGDVSLEVTAHVPDNAAPLIATNPEGHPFPKIEPVEDEPVEPLTFEPPVEPPVERPRLTQIEANKAILAAQDRLGQARIEIQKARFNTQRARTALANQITIWQTGLPAYSREELVRDFLRSEQEKRRQRIEGGIPPEYKPVGKSAIDRAAAYSRDNSPEGAVRSRMTGGGMRRGAFPKSMQHQSNFDPRRGAVAKLPSER